MFVYHVYKWPKNVIYFYAVTTFHTYYSHYSFGGQKLRYEFEIWHANYSHVCPIHIIRFFENFENFGF